MTYDIRLGDSLELIKTLPEHEIDLIVTDPPYKIEINGSGIVGRRGHLKNIELGVGSNIEFDIVPFLYLLKSKLKKFNGYFWASTKQIKEYIDFAVENQFNYDVLVWNKTNPIPAKNNKYLPDTEWCVLCENLVQRLITIYRSIFIGRCSERCFITQNLVILLKNLNGS